MTDEQWEQFDEKSRLERVIIEKIKEAYYLVEEGWAKKKVGGPFKTSEEAALFLITPKVVAPAKVQEKVAA